MQRQFGTDFTRFFTQNIFEIDLHGTDDPRPRCIGRKTWPVYPLLSP
jgi:hypothetical protein